MRLAGAGVMQSMLRAGCRASAAKALEFLRADRRDGIAVAVERRRRDSGFELRRAASSISIALTGPIEAGDIEMERKPRPINAIAESGLPAISPHSVTGVPLRSPASTICAQHAQERHRQRVEAVGDARIAAVDRHDELEQVVRADRDEIDRLPSARRAATAATAPPASRRSCSVVGS